MGELKKKNVICLFVCVKDHFGEEVGKLKVGPGRPVKLLLDSIEDSGKR